MAESSMPAYPDVAIHDTLPKLLMLHARNHPDDVWLREKDLGIWIPYTWKEIAERVRNITLGLTTSASRGDVVGLLGDNRPEWLMGEIATHALGGMSLGIYRDALADEVAYLVTYADVAVIFAEDEEQVDKLLSLDDKIPTVRHIVYSDPRGIRKYDDPRLISLKDLEARGAEAHAREPHAYGGLRESTSGADVAILCTTSGTTSNPKLAMLTGGALLRHCRAYPDMDLRSSADEYVSVLQMPWIMEQIYAFGQALISRMKVNSVEEQETLMADMREIGPFCAARAAGVGADRRGRAFAHDGFLRLQAGHVRPRHEAGLQGAG